MVLEGRTVLETDPRRYVEISHLCVVVTYFSRMNQGSLKDNSLKHTHIYIHTYIHTYILPHQTEAMR
jgi:hypothetical protein